MMMRYRLGRFLMYVGLRVLPPGPVQAELYALVDQWATKVHKHLERTPA